MGLTKEISDIYQDNAEIGIAYDKLLTEIHIADLYTCISTMVLW